MQESHRLVHLAELAWSTYEAVRSIGLAEEKHFPVLRQRAFRICEGQKGPHRVPRLVVRLSWAVDGVRLGDSIIYVGGGGGPDGWAEKSFELI